MKSNKPLKGCLIIFLFIFSIMVITLIVLVHGTSGGSSPKSKYTQIQEEFFQQTKTTEEQQTIIVNILKTCGVEFSSIKHDLDLDHDNLTGYRINTSDIKNVILYLNTDKTVSSIKYATKYLYQNGAVVSNLSKHSISINEASQIQIGSENTIKKILKSPSTAKFPKLTEWYIVKDDGVITVQSYVDSQNSFGAMLRSKFEIIIENDAIKSIIFDGKKVN